LNTIKILILYGYQNSSIMAFDTETKKFEWSNPKISIGGPNVPLRLLLLF
ncbi:45887_t:CDS:1, partial [Gigaspora margarita]